MTTEPPVMDARGLKCPLPVLMTEKQLGRLMAGAELTVLATDPMAKVDIPLYCRQKGYACTFVEDGGVLRFSIRKQYQGELDAVVIGA